MTEADKGLESMARHVRASLVAGIPVAATQLNTAADFLIAGQPSGADGMGSVRLVNAWSVVCAHDDPAYLAVMTGPGVNLPDGRPVARRVRRKARNAEQVRGPALFRTVLDRGRDKGTRHFFLGASESTLDMLVQEVTAQYPGTTIAGTHAPPYTDDISQLVTYCAGAIEGVEADVIWLSLGTPKQDLVAARLAQQRRGWIVGIGAAFDFVAGTVPEAPTWLRRIGLEWLYRLAREPRRLWRRYLYGNSRFLWLAARR